MTITIGVAFFVLVLIIFMQFKVVYQSNETSIDTMREEELKTELANWKSKYEDAENWITSWIRALQESRNKEFNKLADTFINWKKEIINSFIRY